MKYGVFWFFNLNRVVFFSRISFIPLAMLGFYMPILSPLFGITWLLCGIAFIITIITIPLHIPSNSLMEEFISNYELEFCSRIRNQFRNNRQVKFEFLKGYSFSSRIKLRKRIDNNIIYSNLVVVSCVKTLDSWWLISEKKSLLSAKESERKTIKIEHNKLIEIYDDIYDVPNRIRKIIIAYEGQQITIYAKEDYHYRDFIQTIRNIYRK